jgi:hypothetical protein
LAVFGKPSSSISNWPDIGDPFGVSASLKLDTGRSRHLSSL